MYPSPPRYQDSGQYLLSASEDGHVFLIDGRASKKFKPLAHTGTSATVGSGALVIHANSQMVGVNAESF